MALTKPKAKKAESPNAKKSTRGRKKVVKADPELAEFAADFKAQLEIRRAELENAVEHYNTTAMDEMLKDLEEVALTCDLDMPFVDFMAAFNEGRVPPPAAAAAEPPVPRPRTAVVKDEVVEEEPPVEEEQPDAAVPRSPIQAVAQNGPPATPGGRVDAVLPGGAHVRVPATIRPKIGNDALLNVRNLGKDELAFSMNGTPLQLPRSIADKSVNDMVARQSIGAMEYNDCD